MYVYVLSMYVSGIFVVHVLEALKFSNKMKICMGHGPMRERLIIDLTLCKQILRDIEYEY